MHRVAEDATIHNHITTITGSSTPPDPRSGSTLISRCTAGEPRLSRKLAKYPFSFAASASLSPRRGTRGRNNPQHITGYLAISSRQRFAIVARASRRTHFGGRYGSSQ
ncbi:hypothetical protein AVEN_269917-1 [Araneus ventricosus]|uniref:Uncharacterized protein n=1 Tax=Araneus ventricosus TaxID=182803 RepID=A0A4Y2FRX4_ARAVE|nr:hypothetical protein AVEN_269917-1 [Araneus ventricosus]